MKTALCACVNASAGFALAFTLDSFACSFYLRVMTTSCSRSSQAACLPPWPTAVCCPLCVTRQRALVVGAIVHKSLNQSEGAAHARFALITSSSLRVRQCAETTGGDLLVKIMGLHLLWEACLFRNAWDGDEVVRALKHGYPSSSQFVWVRNRPLHHPSSHLSIHFSM